MFQLVTGIKLATLKPHLPLDVNVLVDTQHHPLAYVFLVTVIIIYFAFQIVIVGQGLQVFIYQIKLKLQVKYDVGTYEQYNDVAVSETQEAEVVNATGEVGPVAEVPPG